MFNFVKTIQRKVLSTQFQIGGFKKILKSHQRLFSTLNFTRKGTPVVIEGEENIQKLDFQFIPHRIQKALYRKHKENPDYWTVSRIARTFGMAPVRAKVNIHIIYRVLCNSI